MAESIGAKPVTLPEGGKTAYHAAAMMAAGGLVGLLDAIASVAAVAGLDEKTAMAVYAPLARQALANSERMGIAQALTGTAPARRRRNLKGHLAVLKEHAAGALPLYVEVARREVAIAVRARRARTGKGTRDRGTAGQRLGDADRHRPSRIATGNELANIRSNAQQSRGYPGRPAQDQVRDTDCSAPRTPPGHPPHHSGAPRPVTDQ